MDPRVKVINMLYIAIFPLMWQKVTAIDCYDCNSFNKSDRYCGDPFHTAYGDLKVNCQQGKDGFVGLYPAKYCIKLIGNTVEDDVEMVYRGCSLETLDNQCGDFKFEGVRYRGCMMSCTENACNIAVSPKADMLTLKLVLTFHMMTSAAIFIL